MLVPYNKIHVSDRLRADYGDISTLVESINEFGLIQPLAVRDKLDDNGQPVGYELVAGGRRYAAITQIRSVDATKFTEVPVNYMPHIATEDNHRLVELEENLRRKDMTWQEKVLGVAEVHRIHRLRAFEAGSNWTTTQTGDIFGTSHALVAYSVRIAEAIRDGIDGVLNAEGPMEALQYLVGEKRKQLEKEKHERQKAIVEAQKRKVEAVQAAASADPAAPATSVDAPPPTAFALASAQVVCADSIEWMQQQPSHSFNGVYTDIPYGIDMDHINMKHVDETSAEHDKDDNVALFEPFLRGAYRILAPNSFCVFWCDVEHFGLLTTIAKAAGFRVQRWPLIGVKNTPCKNEAAAYNTTKNYEIAMVCAKGGPTLATRRASSIVPFEWAKDERKQFTHPFAKPFAAHEWIIRTYFTQSTALLDPFCGEGTALLAATKLGLSCVGIDLVESHTIRATAHLTALRQCTTPPHLPPTSELSSVL